MNLYEAIKQSQTASYKIKRQDWNTRWIEVSWLYDYILQDCDIVGGYNFNKNYVLRLNDILADDWIVIN